MYGYLKDEEDHNKLVVDVYASEVVRAIFKWKLEGMSQGRIADKLNMQGVLCPMEYKISLGMKVQTNFRVHKKAMWSPVSVTRIFTNEIYTGVLVQGKSGTPNYKVKKVMPKDEEEWIRVEDSHPTIVTKRNFETVQRIMQKDIRIAPAEEIVYPFSGYLKCADCGQNMVCKHYVVGNKEYTYFICSTHKAKKGCSTHSIDEDTLIASVLIAVKNHIDMILEAEQLLELVESLPENQQNVFNYDVQIVKLKEEIECNKTFKLRLYENLQEGMIGQDEYFLFKKSYAMKIQEAEQAVAAIEAEREQMVNNNREQLSWTEVFKQHQNITEVTRNVIVDLIDHIEILEGKGIHVVFRYHDNWDKLIVAVSNIPDGIKSQMAV